MSRPFSTSVKPSRAPTKVKQRTPSLQDINIALKTGTQPHQRGESHARSG
jgi:hypothetical protein